MAVLPVYSMDNMSARYLPLLAYLSRETGYDVQYVASSSYSGFGVTVEGSGAQLVLCDPISFLTLAKTRQAEALAIIEGEGGAVQGPGLVIAPRGAAIQSLSQLRGLRIGCASQMSAEGFLSQALALRAEGIDVRRECTLVPCGQMDEVVAKVARGQLDAGFIGLGLWDEKLSQELVIVARTEPVPNWVAAAMPQAAPDIRAKVTAALLGLRAGNDEHRKILDGLRAARFAALPPAALSALAAAAAEEGIPY